ncbi:hypothetical protein FPK47_33080, partial [Acinetobacter baumannii]|nr:hypothetical protein [Acinetobacter baumannii]
MMIQYELPGIRTHHLFGNIPLDTSPPSKMLSLIASDREALREIEESTIDDLQLVVNLRARLAELEPYYEYA